MASAPRTSLVEALAGYLARQTTEAQRDGHQELTRFIQWCGRDRSVSELTPTEVADYAESAGMWGADSTNKIKPVKSFLSYLKERGICDVSLAPHLKVSRAKQNSRRVYFKSSLEQAELSPQGFANLQARLEVLRQERVRVVADIKRAMADKDFKENSPLDAAKERQGFIESGVRDLEAILANAVVSDSAPKGGKRVRLGKTVTLKDLSTGAKVRYVLVDPREADPVAGKISGASPVGKALLDKETGQEVQITVPKGTLRYVVEKVEG